MNADATTLFEFLEQTGARVQAYDIGRRIGALSREQFLAFERAASRYPLPMQRKAWFALVQLAPEEPENPLIWFLRLDLDEQGLLVQAGRDYLIGRLLESARARSRGRDPQEFLQDNPHAFKPREDRMALFHAALSADLGLSPSRFYPYALDYFRGSPGWDQWEFVGYQGIADVACRHGDEPLSQAVAHLPKEPLVALCHCLERRALAPPLLDALIHRLREAMTQTPPDITVLAALVRGLSASGHHPPARTAIAGLLAHPASTHIEILAAISGRGWEMLLDDTLLQAYLLRLATNDHGQAAFEHCISDLLSLPSMSSPARRALRAPGQPAAVREAFARMTADAAPTTEQ